MQATTGTSRRGFTPRKAAEIEQRKKFEPSMFEALVEDMQKKRIPLQQITITDDMVPGLRAIIRESGLISYHVNYYAEDGSRPYLKIGEHPNMTVPQARKIATTIRQLSDMGIDPQAGLHERLIRELDEQGTNWRPNPTAKTEKESQELEAAIKPLLDLGIERSEAIKTIRRAMKK